MKSSIWLAKVELSSEADTPLEKVNCFRDNKKEK